MRWGLFTIGVAALAASAAAADDRSALISAMDNYVQNSRAPGTYRALANLGDPDFGSASTDDFGRWEEQRTAGSLFGVESYGDCRTDYAMKTYRERSARLGAGHRYVGQWLRAQRAVFSACNGWNAKERKIDPLPPPIALADPELDRLQRADRAYQAASQLFYLMKMREARAAFAAIAAARGPHQSASAFMIAAIDAGSRPDQFKPGDVQPGAIAEAKGLLVSPKTAGMRSEAHGLIGWLGATADTPETRAAQVAVTLDALHLPLATIRSDPQAADRYHRAADDLPKLWTPFDNSDWWLTGAIPKGYFGSLAMSEAANKDRLAAFQLVPGPCRSMSCYSSGYKFQDFVRARVEDSAKAGDKDAWRVADAQLSGSYEHGDNWAEIDRLIGRVQRSPTDHDVALLMLLTDQQLYWAFEGVGEDRWRADRLRGAALMERWPWPDSNWFLQRYGESLRTLAGGGFIDEARALRDRVGPRLEKDHSGVPGELLMLLAEDRDHFVDAMVKYGPATSPLIDRLPTAGLQMLAQDSRVAQRDRARFARIAWTRAYLIEKRIPGDLDRLMRALNPEIASAWQSKVGARTRDHALLLDVLRTPSMNLRSASRGDANYDGTEEYKPAEIDVYQHSLNNWWCGPLAVDFAERDESALNSALSSDPTAPAGRATAEHLLAQSWLWQSLDPKERAALGTHPMAPKILAEAAVAWGQRANPKHPDGADEALALAVRATRYGCQFQGGHGRWSKAAWDTLHQRFPDSDAAKRTRWWFDCKHFTYGCSDDSTDDQAMLPWPDPLPDAKPEGS